MLRAASVLAVVEATTPTVLTFGDSWGDTGPTYKIIKQAFDAHGADVDSKNRAVGGTTACGWASETKSRKTKATFAKGQALVNAAEEEFGSDGPDFVWYTLGGNDMADSSQHHACLKTAKNDAEAQACVKEASDVAKACTQQLLEPFFKKFPKSKVLQINYDVPCESALCDSTVVNNFMGGAYCKSDKTCQNQLGVYWSSVYVETLHKEYAKSHPGQYTGLNIFGTVQQANGIEGASPGHPVMDRDAGDCKILDEILCIHPTYGTKMATAIGEQFWQQFFSKYVSTDSTVV
jgi:hypothetical protein